MIDADRSITIKLLRDDDQKWIAMAFWYETPEQDFTEGVATTSGHVTLQGCLLALHEAILKEGV